MATYEPPPDGHVHAGFTYFRFVLRGKPDTPGWREFFQEQGQHAKQICISSGLEDWEPISYMGMIYPLWAVKDYWFLREQDAEWKKYFAREGVVEFPPLEELIGEKQLD